MNTLAFCFVTAILMVSIKTSSSLQCWECTSDSYGRCADHFNTTLFPRNALVYNAVTGNPRVVNCDGGSAQFGQYSYQRHVCMKRVETDRRLGRTTYSRHCHTLVGNERVGTCPTHITNPDIVVDFCEYCDTHECNGSFSVVTNIWSLIPVAIALILFK